MHVHAKVFWETVAQAAAKQDWRTVEWFLNVCLKDHYKSEPVRTDIGK